MAKRPVFRLLFFVVFSAAVIVQDATGSRVHVGLHSNPTEYRISSTETELNLNKVRQKKPGNGRLHATTLSDLGDLQNGRKRMLIGSVAPTCTYNECRGCKYKCRAEQVPVEGNDPINSPYHYKCVCHR